MRRTLAAAVLAVTALSVPASAQPRLPWPPAGCDVFQNCLCGAANRVYSTVTGDDYLLTCA